jgi:hypothetical protein
MSAKHYVKTITSSFKVEMLLLKLYFCVVFEGRNYNSCHVITPPSTTPTSKF